jgi:hypothetical protein
MLRIMPELAGRGAAGAATGCVGAGAGAGAGVVWAASGSFLAIPER